MAFRLAFETDNAAFDSDGHTSFHQIAKTKEIARILVKTVSQLGQMPPSTYTASEIIHDINGNAIGSWLLD